LGHPSRVFDFENSIPGFCQFNQLISYPVCSQIWLNCVMDDHHFNDIAKMEKKEQKEQKNKTLL
jgi:hypothetical protein